MDMAAILFNWVEPFKQIVNTFSTEGLMCNLVKTAQAVSEKKIFKNNNSIHIYSPGARTGNPQGTKLCLLLKDLLL